MAVTPIQNITSGYNTSKLNNNFDIIQTKIDQVLLGASDGQNTMYQDFDLNSNDLLNAGIINSQGITINGQPVTITNLGALGPNSVGTAQIIPGAVVDSSVSSISGPKITYIQSGLGAVTKDIQSKAREIFSVKDFGAVGDGITDDTVAFQNAINACNGMLFIPGGTYIVGQLSITDQITIFGEGSRAGTNQSATKGTIILASTSTSNVFLVDSGLPVTIRDLCIMGNGATGGAGIRVRDTAASGVANLFTTIINVRFEQCWWGAYFEAASSWSVRGCIFWNIKNTGIIVDNIFVKDQGDQTIEGSTFLGPIGSAGIVWQGGGGTRIVNNKFLMSACIVANLANNTAYATGQMVIASNSFDCNTLDNTASAINIFSSGATTHNFASINVVGNLFTAYSSMQSALSISGQAGYLLDTITITGNTFYNVTAAYVLSSIYMDYVQNFRITGNTITGNGLGNGIAIGANALNGDIDAGGINNISLRVSNLAPASVRVRGVSNSGIASAIVDGSVITHGLGFTPNKVFVTGQVAAQTYVPFNITNTTFQVAIRNTSGASGTASNISWLVES